MAYTYDPIFAADPSNAANVASNASIIIFDPADAGKAPITITDVTGAALPNPITVNKNGFGPAFTASIDRVAWSGGGFTGYFTSYEGMKAVATDAQTAAEAAASNAGAAAEAELAARVAAGEFKGAKGDDGSNVLPTDTAIKNAITTPGTQTEAALNSTFAAQRSTGRYDPTGKPLGTVTALDTGQAVLNFGGAPASVKAGGYISHTPIAGASASYMQVSTANPIERIGCEVQWQPGATIEQVAFVLPVTPWGGAPLVGPGAGIHFVIAGNGQWHCSYWTGATEQSPYYGSGRCGDIRDGAWHAMSIEITDRAAGKAVINLPDGSFAPIQSPFITTSTSNNAVWEIFEFDGTGITTPARLRKLWVNDKVQVLDSVVGTPGQAVQAVNAMKRTVVEFTASGSGTVPASAVGAYVTLIGPGGGGGSGRRGAAGTVRCGGGAGGSGGVINEQFIPVSALGTSYSVTLSNPGTGGAAITADDTNGANGTAGSGSVAAIFASGSMSLRVLGGAGGSGGTNAAGAGGGAGAPLAIAGASASATGGAGTNGSIVTTGATGMAGAGGGITAANVASNGGNGSSSYLWGNASGGSGGVVDGAAPGSPAAGIARPGDAPGGGAGSITTAAQAGANALGYGCGGAGGGASLNGNNSGKGGDGGPCYARVTFVTL